MSSWHLRGRRGPARRMARIAAALPAVALATALLAGVSVRASARIADRSAIAAAKVSSSGWSTPERIPGHELGDDAVPIVFDSGGDAFTVFIEPKVSVGETISVSYLVRAAVRPVGGQWQAPETLALLGISSAVAVDGQGDATAVWQSVSSVESDERPAGGHWLSPGPVLTPGGEEPQIAIDARGDAIVASNIQAPHQSLGIEAATRTAGGAFSAARVISGRENAFEPSVAINARGDALVAWRDESGPGSPVRAAFYSAAGGWSRPTTVSGRHTSWEGSEHHVAIDERGEAVVVWTATPGPGRESVEENTRSADGHWSGARRVARARLLPGAEVGMDAQGDAVLAWKQGLREWTRVRPAGRSWLASQPVSGTSRVYLPASLAVDARGDALLAWLTRSAIGVASKRPSRRGWHTSVLAADHAGGQLTAAIGPSGDGVVSWLENDGFFSVWRSDLFR